MILAYWQLAGKPEVAFSMHSLPAMVVTVMLLAAACNLCSVKLGKSRDVSFLALSSTNFLCIFDDKYAMGAPWQSWRTFGIVWKWEREIWQNQSLEMCMMSHANEFPTNFRPSWKTVIAAAHLTFLVSPNLSCSCLPPLSSFFNSQKYSTLPTKD